ncbi:MAG: Sensor histidine kinase [uncultured Campylobacterales bacterium]|uniref:histidine kinase n=1 Tax=uncultured Campylobacterales bacterium TaxID=352960 RepID=A0A6S6SUG1_9BACT|nr:MAG: Sensor histidine kinase [uncultured Campylobacterales bacterium]
MQNFANTLSSDIVQTHMYGNGLDSINLKNFKKYNFVLYDKSKSIYGKHLDIKLTNGVYEYSGSLLYITNNTFGHLGIEYLVVIDSNFSTALDDVLNKILLVFSLIFLIICIVGVILGYIFVKPIKIQRLKIDKFIKDTTHELNTPISAVLLCVDSKLTQKNLERLKLSAKRVSDIYKDLTYISFGDVYKPNIQKQNLKEILEEECKFFEILADKKNMKLELSINECFLNIDKEDFKRLSNNLISNAIKYGNTHIKIGLTKEYFCVSDDGIGISKSKDIFNRYTRASSIGGGFGIGLDIVQNIVKRYNFKIKINSTKNIGSTIKIIF